MKYIINSLQNVSHKLLLILNLNCCIGHQQWIRYRNLNSFNLSITSTSSLILILIVPILTSIEICFFCGWNRSPFLSTIFKIKVVCMVLIVLLVLIRISIKGLLSVVMKTYITRIYYFLIGRKYIWIVSLHIYIQLDFLCVIVLSDFLVVLTH